MAAASCRFVEIRSKLRPSVFEKELFRARLGTYALGDGVPPRLGGRWVPRRRPTVSGEWWTDPPSQGGVGAARRSGDDGGGANVRQRRQAAGGIRGSARRWRQADPPRQGRVGAAAGKEVTPAGAATADGGGGDVQSAGERQALLVSREEFRRGIEDTEDFAIMAYDGLQKFGIVVAAIEIVTL